MDFLVTNWWIFGLVAIGGIIVGIAREWAFSRSIFITLIAFVVGGIAALLSIIGIIIKVIERVTA